MAEVTAEQVLSTNTTYSGQQSSSDRKFRKQTLVKDLSEIVRHYQQFFPQQDFP